MTLTNHLQFLDALIESAPDIVITFDVHGVIHSCNRKIESMLGIPREKVLGTEIGHLFPSPHREEFETDLEGFLNGNRQTLTTSGRRIEALRGDGSKLPVSIKISRVESPDTPCFSIFIRDITTILNTEKELETKTRELVSSNASLEQFAAIAAHDLQAPLRTISLLSSRLVDKKRASVQMENELETLERLLGGTKRMQNLIDDLLTLCRVSSREIKLKEVNLNVLVDQILGDLAAPIADVGAKVERDDLPNLLVPDGMLRQLLQNLISNAIKFRRPGVAPEVKIAFKDTGSALNLSVRDNGIGIEEKNFERIFQLFQRLHGRNEYPGSGLGLAICQKIAERLGGKIEVESSLGSGSSFRLVLPKTEFLMARKSGPRQVS
jgi:two-component system sensor kinase FixL